MQLEQNQQQLVKHQFQSLIQLQLEDVDDLFQSHFQRLETALQTETNLLLASKDQQYSTSSLRQLVKNSPYIEQVFILDQQRDTLFPVIKNATQQELYFLQQTQTLLSTKNLFMQPQESPPSIAAANHASADGDSQPVSANGKQEIRETEQFKTTERLNSKESNNQLSAKRSSPAPYSAQLKQKADSAPLTLSSNRIQQYSAEPEPSSEIASSIALSDIQEESAKLTGSKLAHSDIQESVSADSITVLSKPTPTSLPTRQSLPTLKKHKQPKDSGWIAWYNNTQLQHIYWQSTADNEVIGFAINSARLLSDLINLLPDQTEVNSNEQLTNAGIYLKNSRGDISYEWGNIELTPENLKPIKTINLSHPLSSWRLEYISPSLSPTQDRWLEKLLVILVTLTALSLLGWLIYREQTRESRLARQRVNFVNQVSHELKTPLTNVRMYAEMLENHLEEDQTKPKRYLSVINNESQRLSRLIDNVLSFSRLERDSVELSLQVSTVDACIRNTLQAFAPALTQRGLEPVFQSKCTSQVMIDPHCTEQILNNLLSNIEKYAANSGEISIECWHTHSTTFIRIHDNGPGIDMSASNQIFNQFYRVSNKLTDGVTGTGIGLSIARELARKHGGDLILESSQCGACFLLSLHTPEAKE